jgi:hypothetical protein
MTQQELRLAPQRVRPVVAFGISRRRIWVSLLSILVGQLILERVATPWGSIIGEILTLVPVSPIYLALIDNGLVSRKHWKAFLVTFLVSGAAYWLQERYESNGLARRILSIVGIFFFAMLGGLAKNCFLTLRHRIRNRPVVVNPPGTGARGLLRFLCSRKTMERVFEPVLADMQMEWSEATFNREFWRAHWVITRGHFQLLEHIGAQSIVSLFTTVWKAISRT